MPTTRYDFEKWNLFRKMVLEARRFVERLDLEPKEFLTIYVSTKFYPFIIEQDCPEAEEEILNIKQTFMEIPMMANLQDEDFTIVFRGSMADD
jgi:hypothetical protein